MPTPEELRSFLEKRGLQVTEIIPPGSFVISTDDAKGAKSIYAKTEESKRTPIIFKQNPIPDTKVVRFAKWLSTIRVIPKPKTRG